MFWGLKLDGVGAWTGGGGAGFRGGPSIEGIEDNLTGFGGGIFGAFCCRSPGGTLVGGGVETDKDDEEALEQVDGGLGGAIGGGLR